MEIAIGIVFLALFTGALFLLILIVGFYLWRRSKRKRTIQPRRFSSAQKGYLEEEPDHDNEIYYQDDDSAISDSYGYQSAHDQNFTTARPENSADFSPHKSTFIENSPDNRDYNSANSDCSDSANPDNGYNWNYDSAPCSDSSSSYDSSSSSSDSSSSSSDSGSSSSSSSSWD